MKKGEPPLSGIIGTTFNVSLILLSLLTETG